MWFLDNPSRLSKERTEIDKLSGEADWLKKADWKIVDSQLCLDADIELNEHIYSVRMTYPALFPLIPPSVRPLDTSRTWSYHQYVGGELCLEWGPDNWNENVNGADLVRSTYRLLSIDRPLEKNEVTPSTAPSRHALSLGQELRNKQFRFINQSCLSSFLKSQPEKVSGSADCYLLLSRESYTVFVGALQPLGGQLWNNPLFPKELEKTTYHIKGQFFRVHSTTASLHSLNTADLKKAITADDYVCPDIGDQDNQLLLILDQELELHFYRCWDKDNCYEYQTLNVQEPNIESRVGSISKNLDNSRVGIVGLGSAGSKIAVSLARSGVRNLLLVDIDLFFPENICRHELNWEDVGQHKVDGVTHLLRLIDPGMTVNSRKLMLSGQEASSGVSSALNALSQCALIIDATAQEDVFNLLSGVAFQSNTPYIWIQIFEGGIGGSLCRFRPKIEPPPKKIRACILEYFDRIERPKFKAAGNYAAIDESGKPIVATDADVAVIAGHATRMAIDLLSECQPSIFPYSVYLIGLSKGWIFKEPFYTIPIDLSAIKPDTSPTDCPAINAEDHVKFIKGLLDQK